MARFHISIDTSLCAGLGSCTDLAPAAFELDGSGLAIAVVEATDDESVVAAARSCPMAAIRVVDVATGKDAA